MTPETLLAVVSGQSVPLAEPIGGRKPEWTLVEAGFGMGKLSSPYLLAFWYRFARDPAVRQRLYGILLAESMRLASLEGWKQRVEGRLYLGYLVGVVMAEEWMSNLDRQRLADHMEQEWPRGVYQRFLVRKQRKIAMILDRWCAAAHEHIAARISSCDEIDLYEVVE